VLEIIKKEVELACYPVHEPICEVIYEEGITEIKNITTIPFLRSKCPEFWEEVSTATNIGNRNDTTNMGPIRLLLR
jgi:hypothetical protein